MITKAAKFTLRRRRRRGLGLMIGSSTETTPVDSGSCVAGTVVESDPDTDGRAG